LKAGVWLRIVPLGGPNVLKTFVKIAHFSTILVSRIKIIHLLTYNIHLHHLRLFFQCPILFDKLPAQKWLFFRDLILFCSVHIFWLCFNTLPQASKTHGLQFKLFVAIFFPYNIFSKIASSQVSGIPNVLYLFICRSLMSRPIDHSCFFSFSQLGLGTEFRSEKIGFRYSAEENAHSEAFQVPRKSNLQSSKRNSTEYNNT
jgi:hypothetical protein